MSFFTNGTTVYAEETLEQLMNNDKIQPSFYDNFMEGALAIVAESTYNENKLMEAIGVNEAVYFAQTGSEYVYTEGTLSDIWAKVKSFIMKIWEKIKGLIKKFVAMFDKFFASDKDFVKKYKKRILMADTKDISYEGYKFGGIDDALARFNKTSGMVSLKAQIATEKGSYSAKKSGDVSNDEEITEAVDRIRGTLCGKDKVEASDFNSELKDSIYGDKETLEGAELEVSKQVGYIENYNDSKKAVEKTKKEVDRAFKDMIKVVDQMEKDFTSAKDFDGDTKATNPITGKEEKNSEIVKKMSNNRTLLTRSSEVYATFAGVYLQALKDRNRQARAICVKVMSKGGTLQKESASFEYPAYGSSFLENVKFI